MRSLTLMSSGPAAIPAPADTNVALMAQALPVMDLETIWTAKRQLEAQLELAPAPPAIEAWLHDRFVANHPVGLRRVAEQLLSEPDRTDELAALDLPVLVTFGDRDDVWPPALQAEMADRLGAAAVVLPDAGHSPAADLPEVTAQALLAFWAGIADTSRPSRPAGAAGCRCSRCPAAARRSGSRRSPRCRPPGRSRPRRSAAGP